jgi:hypothetical protein
MSTFVYELLSTTDDRWGEIDLLLSMADHESASDDLKNALCRASAVLVVAHFEGFIKDAAKAIINDINNNLAFKDTPSQIKRVFCRSFTGTGTGSTSPSKEENERERKLIGLLDSLNTKIDATPFTAGTSNPKPDVVERICGSLGADKFFSLINESKLDIAFNGTDSEMGDLLKEMRGHLLDGVQTFPYKVQPALFDMEQPSGKSRSGGGGKATLWEEFLDNLLEQRHVIAHGTSTDNRRSPREIRQLHTKTQLLMHATLLAMCGQELSKNS